MQAGGKQSAAWAGRGCLGFVFGHWGPSSVGWPCTAGRGEPGAGQVPAGPKGLCAYALEEVTLWGQRGGERAVPVFLERQAQPRGRARTGLVTHGQVMDPGALCVGAEHPAQLLVLELAEQLPRDLLQRVGLGKHHVPHGQSSTAGPERSVSRAASATALCPGQPRRTPAVLQPWPFPTPCLERPGPCLGKQEGADIAFPVGQGGTSWRGSGLARPALATAGLADPAGLESGVGWRALLLGDVLRFSVGLAARQSPGPSPHMEQAHGACWGQYLSQDGESVNRLVTTSLGHWSVIRRSSKSRLCRADAVRMHSVFL